MNIDEVLREMVEGEWHASAPSEIHANLEGVIATEDVTEAELEAAMVKEFGTDWRHQSGRAKED